MNKQGRGVTQGVMAGGGVREMEESRLPETSDDVWVSRLRLLPVIRFIGSVDGLHGSL